MTGMVGMSSGPYLDTTWTTVEPTTALRFILRSGEKILQQKFILREGREQSIGWKTILEWRDVPLETE